jgi:hypothetical protein
MVQPAKIKDVNPLNSVTASVSLVFYDEEKVIPDNKGAISFHENEVIRALKMHLDGKFINLNEVIPISI